MTGPADSRSPCRTAAGLLLGASLLWGGPAAAQRFPTLLAFSALPSFAWPQTRGDEDRWSGSYGAMYSGFGVVSSRRFGGYSGPIVGFEGGRMWQDGPFIYGIAGGFDYLAPGGGSLAPGFGRFGYSRDLAGALQIQGGTLLTPDVLVYGKLGAWAVHETWRAGATPVSQAYERDAIAISPDARVGVEWAVTDRMTVGIEAGVTSYRYGYGPGFRR